MTSTVEQIKDRLDIVAVISGYIQLQRAGSTYKARCPFHSERTPSFTISPSRQSYHCFGCGVHGDMFTFVQEIEGIDFKGALKILAEQAGVDIVYERGADKEERDEREQLFSVMQAAAIWYQGQLQQHQDMHDYLTKRGLTAETIERFSLGYAPDDWHLLGSALTEQGYPEALLEKAGLTIKGDKGPYDRFRSRIMFPIRDTAGRVVAYTGRIVGEAAHDERNAKYVNSPETELYNKSRVLFGFDMAKHTIRKKDFAIIVEGQMDLLAVHQAGFTNTVAISGTALTPEHCTLLGRMSKNVVLALDSDDAGIKAAGRSALIALTHGFDVKVAQLHGGKDPADILLEYGVSVWRDTVRTASHVVEFLLDVYAERAGGDVRRFQKKVEEVVLPFVARIQSSIDQEHFVKVIAGRLGVSEASVFAQLAKVQLPRDEAQPATSAETPSRQPQIGRLQFDPLSILVTILVWQEGVGEPAIDTNAIQERIVSIVGEETYRAARDTVDEAHVAHAEGLYPDVGAVRAVVAERLEHLLQQHIRAERLTLIQALQRAESARDSKRVSELQQQIDSLNKRLHTG